MDLEVQMPNNFQIIITFFYIYFYKHLFITFVSLKQTNIMADEKQTKKVSKPAAKTTKQESVAIQQINLLAKLGKTIEQIPDIVAQIESLPAMVETLKADATLGLQTFSVAIEEAKAEKQAELDTLIAAKEAEVLAWETKINELDITFKAKLEDFTKQQERNIEQITFDNQKMIRENRFETASSIVKGNGYEIVAKQELAELKSKVVLNQEALDEAVKSAETKAKISYNAEVSNIKSSNALTVKELEIRLKAEQDRADRLETEVEYLKNEITATRATIEKSVAAAKADVTVNQQSGK